MNRDGACQEAYGDGNFDTTDGRKAVHASLFIGWHGYKRDPALYDPELQAARDAVESDQWATAHPNLAALGMNFDTPIDVALEQMAGILALRGSGL